MRNQGNRNPLTSHRFSCYDLCFSASDKKVSLEKKLLELLEERAPGDQGLVHPTPEEEEEVIIRKGRCGGRVEGVAGKHCQFAVDFNVEGKKQSELNIKILGNDGRELKDGQDVNISLQDGRISVEVINPKRSKSGLYKVIVGNAQGESEQDVNVNIADKPGTPGSCHVNNVFHDNCMVNWSPPEDDGGTEIVKYVVEEMNMNEGGGWTEVAEAGPNEKKVKVDGLKTGDKYRFRVKAVNKLGQSSPCEMKGGEICIKDPWGPPSAPGDQGLVQPTPEEEEEVIIKRLRQRMEIPKWKIELVQSYSWPSY